MSSHRRLRQRSSVDVLDDVDWQDRRVRVGISALCVVAAVGVLLGTMDDSRHGDVLAGGDVMAVHPFTPTIPPSPTAPGPPAVVEADGIAGAPPSMPAPEPQAFVATTAFVPTTARPTSPPTTSMTIDLRSAAGCSVASAVRPGASGDDVRCVQRRLRQVLSISLGSDADGRFGPGTETAVRQFQRASGLSVDGVVGATTARLLGIWADEPAAP